MDIADLFRACKVGNLKLVKELIEQRNIDVNERDKWDSTPLYYASLCGRINVVRYLISRGARCEINTFDGERCIYGALTQEIKNILLSNTVVTSKIKSRNIFDQFLLQCLENNDYSDICFKINGVKIWAHKCILSSRSRYFLTHFQTDWRYKKSVSAKTSKVKVDAFKHILEYLYTGRLSVVKDSLDDVIMLAKMFKLSTLVTEIDKSLKKMNALELTKPGTSVTRVVVEQVIDGAEFENLYHAALCSTYPSSSINCNIYSCFDDINLKVENSLFYCHKVFLCGRSDYFRALCSEHFGLTSGDNKDVRVIENISSAIFPSLLSFIYRNQVQFTPFNAYELLMVSDFVMLPELKTRAANYIGYNLENIFGGKVIDLLRLSRLLNTPKLERQCYQYIANNVYHFIDQSDFHQLVIEDAQSVSERQETDSIPVIDEIRYLITSTVQTFAETEEAKEKLKLIDDLLDKYNLDA